MASFDDILKKGKKIPVAAKEQENWLSHISSIIQGLCKLNTMYAGKPGEHFVHSIEQVKCLGCQKALYLLVAIDMNDRTSVTKWRLSSWKMDGDNYYCEDCAKS
ncbi:MAG: hypothetical protein WC523_00070 [Patescibacteria group bacterium]